MKAWAGAEGVEEEGVEEDKKEPKRKSEPKRGTTRKNAKVGDELKAKKVC